MIGKILSQYKVIREIGSGGMGIVYEAEDTVLNRRVAVKTVKQIGPLENRLLVEAQAISRISHPNIATVFDYGKSKEGVPYIVMELVEGDPFDKYVSKKKISIRDVLQLTIQIANALQASHENGIVHRDIKPSNIIVSEEGFVKVLDFGLAKRLDDDLSDEELSDLDATRTQKGVILGTPLYLSPEQAKGELIDERSDIFSLGSLLYEALTGVAPFEAESVIEICARIIKDEPVLPSEYCSNIPRLLEKVIVKALAKKPEDRFESTKDFAASLAQASDAVPELEIPQKVISENRIQKGVLTALRTSFVDTIRQPKMSVSVFVLMALLGGLAFFFWQSSNSVYKVKPEAFRAYQKGVQAYENGLLQSARENFEISKKRDPEYALSSIRLAEVLDLIGHHDEAELNLSRGLELSASGYSHGDVLKIKAVNKTLLRDFAGAIRLYQERLEEVDEQNRVGAYFEVGVALKRNNQVEEAIDSFTQVVSLNSDFAGAHLILGTLFAQKQRYEKAASSFSRAERYFSTQGLPEGLIEVGNQRAYVLATKGDPTKGLDSVVKSLETARVTQNQYQQVKCLILMSRIYRLTRDFSSAKKIASEAVEISKNESYNQLRASSIRELGTVYFFSGDRTKAKALYQESKELAHDGGYELEEKRALLQLGALAVNSHEAEEAFRYVGLVEKFFDEGGYERDMLDVLSVKGQAYTAKGEFELALALQREIVKRASKVGDLNQIARAKRGCGVNLAALDRLPEALPLFFESYSIYSEINQTFIGTYSLLSHVEVAIELGDFESADKSLGLIAAIINKHPALMQRFRLLSATYALNRFELSDAVSHAEYVVALKGPHAPEAKSILALAETLLGKKDQLSLAEKAVEENQQRDYLSSARLYLNAAYVAFLLRDQGKSLQHSERVIELLESSNKTSSLWQAKLIQAKAQEGLGLFEISGKTMAESYALFSTLRQKWGAENFSKYIRSPRLKKLLDLMPPIR